MGLLSVDTAPGESLAAVVPMPGLLGRFGNRERRPVAPHGQLEHPTGAVVDGDDRLVLRQRYQLGIRCGGRVQRQCRDVIDEDHAAGVLKVAVVRGSRWRKWGNT